MLTIAVLVILITAPIGAAAIALAGPRLLQKSAVQTAEMQTSTEADSEKKEDNQTASIDDVDASVVYVL